MSYNCGKFTIYSINPVMHFFFAVHLCFNFIFTIVNIVTDLYRLATSAVVLAYRPRCRTRHCRFTSRAETFLHVLLQNRCKWSWCITSFKHHIFHTMFIRIWSIRWRLLSLDWHEVYNLLCAPEPSVFSSSELRMFCNFVTVNSLLPMRPWINNGMCSLMRNQGMSSENLTAGRCNTN